MITQQWRGSLLFLFFVFADACAHINLGTRRQALVWNFAGLGQKIVPGCQKRHGNNYFFCFHVLHLSSDEIGLIWQHTLMHLRGCKTCCLQNMLKPTHSGAIDVFFSQHLYNFRKGLTAWRFCLKLNIHDINQCLPIKGNVGLVLKNTYISVPFKATQNSFFLHQELVLCAHGKWGAITW